MSTVLTRLFAAAGVVASLIIWVHEKATVVPFLETAGQAIVLVVVGRLFTTRLIAFTRCRRITSHRTVLIGGGPLAAEVAEILTGHPVYGLDVQGFVDDGQTFPATQNVPRLGRLADLDAAVITTGSAVLLVADGTFDERGLAQAVQSTACMCLDLLVVPTMHHFDAQLAR